MSDIISEGVNHALAEQWQSGGVSQIPSGEPIFAQTDEYSRDILIRLCSEFQEFVDPDTSKKFVAQMHKYPKIVALLSSVGHLDGTTNYSWEQAQVALSNWLYLQYYPVERRYKRKDPLAITILNAIRGMKERMIFGDSQGGSRQRYVVQLAGSNKVMELITGSGSKENKQGFLRGIFR